MTKLSIYAKLSSILDKKSPDEKVIEREFGNLEQIDDHYEKMVISLDDLNLGNREGIAHINAWEFIS